MLTQKRAIKSYNEVCIPDETVMEIYRKLKSAHVEDRHFAKDHKKEAQSQQAKTELKIRNGICLRCGGNLVERKGRYGGFWGCSNYPRCKFTIE